MPEQLRAHDGAAQMRADAARPTYRRTAERVHAQEGAAEESTHGARREKPDGNGII